MTAVFLALAKERPNIRRQRFRLEMPGIVPKAIPDQIFEIPAPFRPVRERLASAHHRSGPSKFFKSFNQLEF